MTKISIFFFSLLFNGLIYAQDKLPAFGKIEKAELEMKDCDFDPGAEALVLHDVGDIRFAYIDNIGWQAESVYRVRIKILKASALDRAQIKIRYYSLKRAQEISGIHGISFNLDAAGNISETKMEKSAVFDKVIDKETAEISFAIPDVKVGTVFEYKYKMLRKSFGYIPEWQFQQKIPVKYSAYNLMIPEYFYFTVQTTNRQHLEKKEGQYAGEGTWYIMRNIPGLKEEPFSSGIKNYLQRMEFQLTKIQATSYYEEFRNTWPKIINELLEDEDFGKAYNKNLRGTDEIVKKAVAANTVKEKIRIIYNYVQRNMLWNKNYSKYSEMGIKDAWDKKTGNIADINFILIRLLRDAGIDADPLLASTKNNGTVNAYFPFLNQFNCVLASVKDGESWYVMNAADKFNSFDMVPDDVLYTNVLVVDKKNGGLARLNRDHTYKDNIFFTCSIDNNGELTGQADIKSSGYARNIRLGTYKKADLKETFEDNSGINIKIDSLLVNNEMDEMQPLEQKFTFSADMQSSGAYFFLPFALFTGIGKNRFIEENRVMDIDFGFPKSYLISGTYFLPDNYVVNAFPKNTRLIMPDTSIVLSRIMQVDGNIISFRFTLDIKVPGYEAASYPYIKEFFKKMYAILEERIVLTKK